MRQVCKECFISIIENTTEEGETVTAKIVLPTECEDCSWLITQHESHNTESSFDEQNIYHQLLY